MSSSSERAVRKIMGTPLVRRTARQTERPSSPGIMISSRMASNSVSSRGARASTPSRASAGLSPLLRK